MKKYIILLLISFVSYNSTQAQDVVASICNCTHPATSSCTTTCTFSDCCICWNPYTQSGACGCYWGVANCRNGNNTSSNNMGSGNFGELNPDAKISFSFEKFQLLFNFFNSRGIEPSNMVNVFSEVKNKYSSIGTKVPIANNDFASILSEYSKLIDKLSPKQKEELNYFINSIK